MTKSRKQQLSLLLIFLLAFVTKASAQVPSLPHTGIPKEKDTVEVKTLDKIIIQGRYYKRYIITEPSSDLRLQSSLIETPQNVQIISSVVLKDQLAYNMNESVTRNVSGTFREDLHNGISPDIYSRGGYITAQRNGVDLRPLKKGPVADDVSIIETIEFVKGPSGLMNAISDPAGSYNVITKKPTGSTRSSVKLIKGSFGFFRGEVDLDGVFDTSNKLQYRFNLMGMNTKSFIKFDNNERLLIAPVLKYNISKNSSVILEYIYQRFNYMLLSEAQISPYGYGTLPVDFTISGPNIRPYKANDHNAFLTYENKFKKDWSFVTKISRIHNNYDGSIMWVYGRNKNNPDTLDRYFVYDAMRYDIFSAQSFLQGKFVTGKIKHSFVSGIDYNYKENSTIDTWETATTRYPLSISNPVYAPVIDNNGIGGSFVSENEIDTDLNKTNTRLSYISTHVADELAFLNNKLKMTMGIRLTQAYGSSLEYGSAPASSSDVVLTPRAGINYAFNESFSMYGLYDNSFLPQAGVAFDGTPLKPLHGRNMEVGIKKDWNRGAWNTTFSVYQIRRNRIILNDAVSNQLYQTGETESKGVEFDLRGRIAKGLNMITNYAYTDSKITKDDKNPDMVGIPTPNRVKHIHNTWINYALPIKANSGFSISAGYQFLAGRAERFSRADAQTLMDIFRVDGGIGYANGKINVQILINNIVDKKMYNTGWRNRAGDMYYWVQQAPRNYRLALTLNL